MKIEVIKIEMRNVGQMKAKRGKKKEKKLYGKYVINERIKRETRNLLEKEEKIMNEKCQSPESKRRKKEIAEENFHHA